MAAIVATAWILSGVETEQASILFFSFRFVPFEKNFVQDNSIIKTREIKIMNPAFGILLSFCCVALLWVLFAIEQTSSSFSLSGWRGSAAAMQIQTTSLPTSMFVF